MELFKSIFLIGGLKEFVRLLCLILLLIFWTWLVNYAISYFTDKEYYANLIRSKNIPAIFHCICSYLFVLLHLCILICIIIWAWR